NHAGGSVLPAFSATPKTMRLGYNVRSPDAGNPTLYVNNLFLQATGSLNAADLDAHRRPRSTSHFPIDLQAAQPIAAPHDPRGYRSAPTGVYSLRWDGRGVAERDGTTPMFHLYTTDPHTTVSELSRTRLTTSSVPNNTIRYSITTDGSAN